MTDETITSELMRQSVRTVTFENGFTVQMCPMPGYAAAYAMLTVGVGSIDVAYRRAGRQYPLPAGIAHYIEHKLFDCPYGDAMEHFSATGASANAFTSFDKTAYYFSCTERFGESLGILLDFAMTPYFRKRSVERERGIITEEIRMYQDSPDWAVMGDLLQILYHNHPVRVDIAGTEESVAEIDAHLLRRCYDLFYRPDNMVLSVAGNFVPEEVLRLARQYCSGEKTVSIMPAASREPLTPVKQFTSRKMPISTPIFEMGFKAPTVTGTENMRRRILDELLLDLVAGETTALYRELYQEGKINSTFGSEVMAGRDFICCLFDGESREPRRVYERICDHVRRMLRDGISEEDFLRCQKANYGRYIGMYSREDSVAGLMASAHFAGMRDIYYPLEIIRSATADELMECLREDFLPEHSALSVMLPANNGSQEQPDVL